MFTTSFNEAKKASDTRNADKPRPMWSQAQRRERMLVALYPWVRRRIVNTPRSLDEVDDALYVVLLLIDNTLQGHILASLHISFAANRNGNAIALHKGTANDANGAKDNHTTNCCACCTGNAFSLLLS